MEDEEEVFEENRNDENTNFDGSDQAVQKCHKIGMYLWKKKLIWRFFSFLLFFMLILIPQFFSRQKGIEKGAIFSPTAERRRSRQQSTSLMRHPIEVL